MKMRSLLPLLLLSAASLTLSAQTEPLPPSSPWLFAGFKGNSEDGVFFALSPDGFHWTLANAGKPVVHQTVPGELMRDPFLQRSPDGSFVMVWTWSWHNNTIGFSSSRDLLTWAPHRELPVMAAEPTVQNTWAPAIYWEPAQKRWLIFWSSTIPGRFPGDNSGDANLNHRIWSTTTRDFKSLTPPTLFFDPGYSVIDATLLPTPQFPAAPFHLVFKDERKIPLEKHLLTASSSSIEGPWTDISQPFSEPWSEGAAIIPVPGGFLAYYDHYTKPQHYAAMFTPDFRTWTDASGRISFPPGLRHGSFLQITQGEYDRLRALH